MVRETSPETVFLLWCRLTATDPDQVDIEEREAFWARPQVPDLVATPYSVVLDAGIAVAPPGLPTVGALDECRPHGTPNAGAPR
jgi:hypothetical protein